MSRSRRRLQVAADRQEENLFTCGVPQTTLTKIKAGLHLCSPAFSLVVLLSGSIRRQLRDFAAE